MKNIITAAVAVALLALAATTQAQVSGGRIVTVDLNRVFSEYYKTIASTAKLKETAETYNKEQDDMLASFRKLSDDLAKLQEDQEKPEYTDEVRAQKRKLVREKLDEIKVKEQDIQNYRRSHADILQQQQERMRQGIIKEIQEVIAKEARDLGYLYVLDKSGTTFNRVPTIIYSQDSLDITEDIVKVLNKNAPKPAPEAPKTDKKEPAKK